MPEPLRMAVVIVNYNTREHLRACLKSLPPQLQEIVVVDNDSSDGSVEMVRLEFPWVLCISAPNAGYGAGANRGVAACTRPYVLLLNSDTRVLPGSVDALCLRLDSEPQAAIVGPRLIGPDGALQRSCRQFPGSLAWLLDNPFLAGLLRRIPGGGKLFLNAWAHDQARTVPWFIGAALAIRRDVFMAAGGFDETFFLYCEEIDLCYRLRQSGWPVLFAPEAVVIHEGGASTRLSDTSMESRIVRSTIHFYRRHYKGIRLAGLLAMTRALVLVRRAFSGLRGRRVNAANVGGTQRNPPELHRLRVLTLLPFSAALDAKNGGARVMGQYVAELAKRHRLAVLCFKGKSEAGMDPVLSGRCEIVKEVTRRQEYRSRLKAVLSGGTSLMGVLRGTPKWAKACRSREFESQLEDVITGWNPDVIHMHYHVMGQYARWLRRRTSAPMILTQHEPRTAAAREERKDAGILRKVALSLKVQTWRRFERKVIESVDAVIVFTDKDRRTLECVAPHARIRRIPFGTFIPHHPLSPCGDGSTILFVGNFIHPPNRDAAVRLIGSIFPPVRRGHPDASLYIIGEGVPAAIREMGGSGVTVTGAVPDIQPYLEKSAVIALPLRYGGGMRVKTLEALAAGKAVVASPLAVEGLEVRHGRECLLAETDQEFSECVTRVIENRELRISLGSRARQWACQHLTWENSVRAHEDLYFQLIGRHGRP